MCSRMPAATHAAHRITRRGLLSVVMGLVAAATVCAGAESALAQGLGSVLGDVVWGASRDEVLAQERERLMEEYRTEVAGVGDPLEVDRLRRAMDERFEAIEETWVEFDGARTGYEVSVIGSEIRAGAGQAMLVVRHPDQVAYWVFSAGALTKLIITYDMEDLNWLSFDGFVEQVGQYLWEPDATDYTYDEYDIPHLARVIWTDEWTRLRMESKAQLFNTYILVYSDVSLADDFTVADGSRESAPSGSRNRLMDMLNNSGRDEAADNSNIVDSIIGSRTDVSLTARTDDPESGGPAEIASTALDDDETLPSYPRLQRTRPVRQGGDSSSSGGSDQGVTIY